MKIPSLFHHNHKGKRQKSGNDDQQDYDLYIEDYNDYVREDYLVDRKKPGNGKQLMFVTYIFVAVFVAMMGYTVYYQAVKSPEVINSSYNKRQDIFSDKIVRGKILSNQKEVLAETQVASDGTETRYYPYENIFAHVVGYSAKGKSGIESNANFTLLRSNAPIFERVRNTLQGEKNMGDNVVTTLDLSLQKTAYNAMGSYRGAIIVMEPDTGKILAMVSKPDFNPNTMESSWDSLVADASGESRLLNRVTHGVYPPGSTFKIITTLAYLRENNNVDSYQFDCTGSITKDNVTINCYHNSVHGAIDLRTSFAKSCNSSFANIGLMLDKGEFAKTCDSLLFDQKLSLPFSYKQSSVSISEDSDTDEVMQTAIGQGKTQMTPLHMAMITSAIANEGAVMKPYLIDSVENYEGTLIKEYSSKKSCTIMSEEEASILKELMRAAVTEGTASKLSASSYTAYGKTGSAEYNNEKGMSHSWFTGFAEANGKTIVTTIIVEGAGSGSEYAVPIAGKLFSEYFTNE